MSEVFVRLVRSRWLLTFFLCSAVLAAYANHFHNSFHFDDEHTITDNSSIRCMGNLPRFFTDATTFSVLPANRSWRPLVTASLAVDYWLGSGLNPFWFQLSTFLWYLVLVALLFFLFQRIATSCLPDSSPWVALFSAALFGLHPVCAETVNYINQRAEVFSTLGVVTGLYLYAARPGWRHYLLYLLPVALALLSKPPALVFPVLLFVYVWLFEDRKPRAVLRAILPAILLSTMFGIIQAKMTPATFVPGAASAFADRITQPYVALRYFRSFLLPLWLSADTDLKPLTSILSPEAVAGFAFLIAALVAAWFCSRRRELKPAGFGLWWFLIALAPTSLFPLAEVENDHRMFFAFAGLSLSAGWILGLTWNRWKAQVPGWIAPMSAAVLLAVCAYGVHVRNQVWHDDISLWRDVTAKSPGNGRGWMNYGTALMARGKMEDALRCFREASVLTPSYDLVEVNLGVATGALHRDTEAVQHFQRAIALAPSDAIPPFYYARWLHERGRETEAMLRLRAALALNPDQPGARQLMAAIGAVQPLTGKEKDLASRTPEDWLQLSLDDYRAQRYLESIGAAQTAIYLRPGYAEAYNNVGAAYAALHLWGPAIQADRQALRLKPDYQLAKNNLAWALAQKHILTASPPKSNAACCKPLGRRPL